MPNRRRRHPTPETEKPKNTIKRPEKRRAKPHQDDSDSDDSEAMIEYRYTESSEDDTMSDDDNVTYTKSGRRVIPPKRKRPASPLMETDSDDDDFEDEDNEVNDEDEEDEDEMEDEEVSKPGVIQIRIGGGQEEDDPMVPKRHDMDKEPAIIKKFVELVTKPMEDVGIDAQIDQFKAMESPKQKALLEALEARPTATDTGAQLMFRILTMKIPPEVQSMALAKYQALQTMDPSTSEYFKQRNWLDKFCSMPFGQYKDLPVKLEDGAEPCGQFMGRAKDCLDSAVYGQDEAKLQILQFIASKIANHNARGTSLLLIGSAGIGKTSIIKSIAKALEWPFQFISLGGDSDASTYTGHQLVYESSHAGKIANSLVAAKSMSMVLMFDEVDKISQTAKGEEVSNLLIHLTDPVQNADFEDKYLAGVPIDLSKVMFVFSANDINKIDKVLLDRMNVIKMKGYNSKDKLVIAERYLLPSALEEVNLKERVMIGRDVLEYIIENYAKEETGVRTLKRCIEGIVGKLNMLRMYNSSTLPFHIKDFTLPFIVKKEHVDLFLKRKDEEERPWLNMYV
jgi:hypothetical protein